MQRAAWEALNEVEGMNDEDLRQRVQGRLTSLALPRHLPAAQPIPPGQSPPPFIEVGSSLEDPCAVCDQRGTEMRYNLPTGSLAFHHRCHAIWDEERSRGAAVLEGDVRSRPDGGVEHVECPGRARKPLAPMTSQPIPEPPCPVCSQPISPTDGVVKDDEDIVHIACFARQRAC
jgi:hypothetical protein